jgi:N-acetylglucosaminyldiphosphoundecaprenol N-acetyl-beta-D-mannosaminyltransferase
MINIKFFHFDGLTFTIGKLAECSAYVARLPKLNKEGQVVLPCSLNDLAAISKNKSLKAAYDQVDILFPDGMPLVWAIRSKGQSTDRIYGPDLMKHLLTLPGVQRAKHIFYGSSPGTLKKLITTIKKISSALSAYYTISPPYRPLTALEERKYIAKIKQYKPDYLWLGLSSPKQVLLAAKWKRKFPKTTILCVGAAFDILAGTVPRAPHIVQVMGLEWAFRLLMEPKRLWKRYLVDIPLYLFSRLFSRP